MKTSFNPQITTGLKNWTLAIWVLITIPPHTIKLYLRPIYEYCFIGPKNKQFSKWVALEGDFGFNPLDVLFYLPINYLILAYMTTYCHGNNFFFP